MEPLEKDNKGRFYYGACSRDLVVNDGIINKLVTNVLGEVLPGFATKYNPKGLNEMLNKMNQDATPLEKLDGSSFETRQHNIQRNVCYKKIVNAVYDQVKFSRDMKVLYYGDGECIPLLKEQGDFIYKMKDLDLILHGYYLNDKGMLKLDSLRVH